VDSDDVKHINDNMVQLNDDLASLGAYVNEFEERLRKVEGMLKFCYAICNNDGIKRICDENAGGARRWGGAQRPSNNSGYVPRSSFVPSPGGLVAPNLLRN